MEEYRRRHREAYLARQRDRSTGIEHSLSSNDVEAKTTSLNDKSEHSSHPTENALVGMNAVQSTSASTHLENAVSKSSNFTRFANLPITSANSTINREKNDSEVSPRQDNKGSDPMVTKNWRDVGDHSGNSQLVTSNNFTGLYSSVQESFPRCTQSGVYDRSKGYSPQERSVPASIQFPPLVDVDEEMESSRLIQEHLDRETAELLQEEINRGEEIRAPDIPYVEQLIGSPERSSSAHSPSRTPVSSWNNRPEDDGGIRDDETCDDEQLARRMQEMEYHSLPTVENTEPLSEDISSLEETATHRNYGVNANWPINTGDDVEVVEEHMTEGPTSFHATARTITGNGIARSLYSSSVRVNQIPSASAPVGFSPFSSTAQFGASSLFPEEVAPISPRSSRDVITDLSRPLANISPSFGEISQHFESSNVERNVGSTPIDPDVPRYLPATTTDIDYEIPDDPDTAMLQAAIAKSLQDL